MRKGGFWGERGVTQGVILGCDKGEVERRKENYNTKVIGVTFPKIELV